MFVVIDASPHQGLKKKAVGTVYSVHNTSKQAAKGYQKASIEASSRIFLIAETPYRYEPGNVFYRKDRHDKYKRFEAINEHYLGV